MSRLQEVLESSSTPRLIPYLMAGDPDQASTLALIQMLEEEGVTAIELGVPFSDPSADGPVIQAAGQRALQNGVTLTQVLQLGRKARESGVQVPLILFTYFNPVLQFGLKELVEAADEAGFDGVIIPDLPHEESRTFRSFTKERDLPFIPLVAPTSQQRIQDLVAQADGFVYCVSSLGTTGVRSEFATNVEEFLSAVKKWSPVPTAIGFGISTSEQVKRFSSLVDGVIVGSAFVKKIEEEVGALKEESSRPEAVERIRAFVRELISN